MPELLWITREGSDVQGKPRVFFCGYNQEQSLYLEAIAQDVLGSANCAVYYFNPDNRPASEDEWISCLNQMQLIVIAVTQKMLTQPNPVTKFVLPFALAHHIPVLPIMEEPGLETMFNEAFGNLHFLLRNDSDQTALAYKEKLNHYLQSVLVDDQTAQQIRESFEAYIFLSYRKKNRQQAQQLMRLVHEDPNCRDVAIWYDEFLTPGESFSKSIQSVLEKSNLFLLAVTPNLTEDGNYVMCQEYPMAKKLKKPILPAMLTPTDVHQLQDCYPQIPECVNPRDPQQFASALAERLGAVNLRKKDSDPRHLYYMGLAYLSGVDVEVDHAKAETLITQAAQAGWIDATVKLVTMYQQGQGVARDFSLALQWSEHLATQAAVLYQQAPSESIAGVLTAALLKCNDFLEELGQPDRQISVLNHLVEQIRQIMVQIGASHPLETTLADALHRLGKLYVQSARLQEARQHFFDSLEILERHLDTNVRDIDIWLTSQNYYYLSSFSFVDEASTGTNNMALQIERTTRLFEKLLQIRKRSFEKEGSREAQKDLALAYERLGDALCRESYPDLAIEQYQMANMHYSHLGAEVAEMEIRRASAMICQKLGRSILSVQRSKKDKAALLQATQCLQTAVSCYEDLCGETDIPLLRKHWAEALALLAEARGQGGADCDEIADILLRALNLYLDLVKQDAMDPSSWQLQRVLQDLQKLYSAEEKTDLAAFYKHKLPLEQVLVEKTGSADSRRRLALAHIQVGHAQDPEQRLATQNCHYEIAVELLGLLAKETGTTEDRAHLATGYESLGFAKAAQNCHAEGRRLWEKAAALRTDIARETDTSEAWHALAGLYHKGGMLLSFRQRAEGLALLQKALPILQKLRQWEPENESITSKLQITEKMIARLKINED